MWGTWNTTWFGEILPLLFWQRGNHHHRSQTACIHVKKDVATLSQHIQCILLKIHQYRVQIIYKPGPEIFIADWLSRHNHVEGKDKPIKDMDIQVDAIQNTTDLLECISMAEIQQASSQDDHLQQLKSFIIAGWPDTKEELHTDLRPYLSFKEELAVIDGVIRKGRCIVIPNSLRQQVLNQLHTNHMGIEKTKLLAHESVYWSSINADMESYIKHCATCLEFQHTCQRKRSSIMTYHSGHGKSSAQMYSISIVRTICVL